jgi:hypothetical protein
MLLVSSNLDEICESIMETKRDQFHQEKNISLTGELPFTSLPIVNHLNPN